MKICNYLDIEPVQRTPQVSQRRLITADDGAKSFWMVIWELEPGSSRPPESHSREHGILVLSGKGVFQSGGDKYQIAKDSVIFIGSNEDHSFTNDGNEPLRYLLFSQAGPLRD